MWGKFDVLMSPYISHSPAERESPGAPPEEKSGQGRKRRSVDL